MAKSLLVLFVVYPAVPGLLLALLLGAVRMFVVSDDRKRNDWFVAAAALALPANIACEWFVGLASAVRPLKYDLYIYQIDGLLGFQPSFVLGQIVARHLWMMVVLQISYGILPLVIVAVFAAYLWGRPEREAVEVVRTFVLNLVAAVPIYLLFPVCGPQAAFPDFPSVLPQVTAHPILLLAVPNCIPSVHTSSALLVAWYLRRWAVGRVFGVMYLVLMILATLASGQHYLFDLFAAVPYAAAVYWLVGPRVTRRKALAEAARTTSVCRL